MTVRVIATRTMDREIGGRQQRPAFHVLEVLRRIIERGDVHDPRIVVEDERLGHAIRVDEQPSEDEEGNSLRPHIRQVVGW